MENIGPLLFFILYMAVSAWAKRRKAQAQSQRGEEPDSDWFPEGESQAMEPEPPKKKGGLSGLFEQLKEELSEMASRVRDKLREFMLDRNIDFDMVK